MIKKLIVLLTLAVLYGCGSDAPSIFKSEIEGSAKNFEDDIHGTYASTYTLSLIHISEPTRPY